MHEFSLCQNLLRQVEKVAAEHPQAEVKRIHVQIGPLSHITAQQLIDTFAIVSAGSRVAGAELHTETIPLRVSCPDCGTESDVEAAHMACPTCGGQDTRVVSGDDLIVTHVELQENDQGEQHA